MPIRPELRHLYSGPNWRAVRTRILVRAGHRCEQCRKPDGQIVWVVPGCGDQYWSPRLRPVLAQYWISCRSGLHQDTRVFPSDFSRARRLRVILTIAHLNHNPRDNRDENLKALCQWCHLNHDKDHHKRTRERRKDLTRPLLQSGA